MCIGGFCLVWLGATLILGVPLWIVSPSLGPRIAAAIGWFVALIAIVVYVVAMGTEP